MARSFGAANTDQVVFTRSGMSTTTGTISIWAKPTWSSGDSTQRFFWNDDADAPSFQRFTDNNIYCGFTTPQRIVIADTGLFTAGTWAHWLFTYDCNNTIDTLYKDGTSKGTTVNVPGAYTLGSTTMNIGTDKSASGHSFDGSLADFAMWSVVLTVTEIAALSKGARPRDIRPGSLINWLPLDGLQSPEPDLSGNANNGTLTGTALATGPPFMMQSPRTPCMIPGTAAAAQTFQPAWAMRNRIVVEGIGI